MRCLDTAWKYNILSIKNFELPANINSSNYQRLKRKFKVQSTSWYESIVLKTLSVNMFDKKVVNSSVWQSWAIQWTLTDLKHGLTYGGVVSTPLPIKLLSFEPSFSSPGLKLKGRAWRADALTLSNWTIAAWTARPTAAYPWNIIMPWWCFFNPCKVRLLTAFWMNIFDIDCA